MGVFQFPNLAREKRMLSLKTNEPTRQTDRRWSTGLHTLDPGRLGLNDSTAFSFSFLDLIGDTFSNFFFR